MTDQELQQQREHRWRLDGKPVRTLEDARAFLESVGFCLMYPARPLAWVPTFIGANAGSAEKLPDMKHAYADPRAQEATELMVGLLRERSAFELNFCPDTTLIIAAPLFPYFYALLSDRNPKAPPKTKAQGARISPLAGSVFAAIQKHGPSTKRQLRELVGGEPTDSALDRALGDLWSVLKITRVSHNAADGASWDVLYRWAPEAVKEGVQLSAPEAVTALISKYVETAIAASQDEIEQFFSHLVARSRIREAVNALQSARELSFVTAGTRTLIQMATHEETTEQRKRSHGQRQ